MMRSRFVGLVGLGFLPLVLGFLLNWMMALPIPGIFYTLLSILLLVGWGYLSFKVSSPSSNPFLQALLACSFGLLMLMLVLYQELVMGRYWGNLIGSGTQFFFLPWLSLASTIISPLMHTVRMWLMYVTVWIGLFISSCIGCFKKRIK